MSTPLPSLRIRPIALSLALAYGCIPAGAAEPETTLSETVVLGTAEETLKQAPGVSTITAEDIASKPPANDLSEIIRTMPGVNLTGNSTSGQRGNNRQIDLRGMGPENTLILIDGKPVNSRAAVRYGWRGERDTRGDSNWVPAEQVERVEVIRGPAAARYGNGAAGGVVNIVTRQPTEEWHGQVTLYANMPQHSEEGATQRVNFGVGGALSENLSLRLYGNRNKTEADDRDINDGHQSPGYASALPAGREGVSNRDLGGRLSWKLSPANTLEFDASYSRQSNIYAGDTQNNGTNAVVEDMYGEETNRITKNTYAVTHKGKYDFGTSLSYVQLSETANRRIQEGLVGGTEGMFLAGTPNYLTSDLKEWVAHSELSFPFKAGFNQMMTVGTEYTEQKLTDPASNLVATSYGGIPGINSTGRSSDASAKIVSVFAENNIEIAAGTLLTPGLRFDKHSESGVNWSPSLNLTQVLTDTLTLKAGIARAYKAPNLYQSNPNYLLFSSGNGCNTVGNGTTGCYLLGNDDLDAETSINKELGIEYKIADVSAGITWFRNDYRDKIQAGTTPVGITTTGNRSIYQWTNIPKAVVEGIEGSLRFPLRRSLDWITNFTYMLQSKNKTTGDYLSIIPKYTVNSSLDWKINDAASALFSVTWYGKQEPMKYDYKGNAVTGSSANSVSPYAIASLSGNYAFSKNLKLTAGINNLFDKRLYREGNAVSASSTAIYGTSGGAGAATYNEPGRTYYVSLTTSF